jgi:hypothetical protein
MREGFFMKSSTILSSELLPAAYLYKYIPEKKEKFIKYFVAVFRIHDILGWIRIRGSMPLTNGSGSGS